MNDFEIGYMQDSFDAVSGGVAKDSKFIELFDRIRLENIMEK